MTPTAYIATDSGSVTTVRIESYREQTPVSRKFLYNYTYDLFNMNVRVYSDDSYMVMESTKWPSLSAFGQDAEHARAEFISDAKAVLRFYESRNTSELTDRAIEYMNDLRHFVSQVQE